LSRLASAGVTGRSFIGRTTGTRGSIASVARGASEGKGPPADEQAPIVTPIKTVRDTALRIVFKL
jgi:hypothetical protein